MRPESGTIFHGAMDKAAIGLWATWPQTPASATYLGGPVPISGSHEPPGIGPSGRLHATGRSDFRKQTGVPYPTPEHWRSQRPDADVKPRESRGSVYKDDRKLREAWFNWIFQQLSAMPRRLRMYPQLGSFVSGHAALGAQRRPPVPGSHVLVAAKA
jgi:hypothetical protein